MTARQPRSDPVEAVLAAAMRYGEASRACKAGFGGPERGRNALLDAEAALLRAAAAYSRATKKEQP